jgi:hypothetical protein
MSTVLPNSRIDRLEFFESRIGPWSLSATQIGLSTSLMSALSSQTSAARAAYQAMVAAHNASKSATQGFYQACATMVETGTDYIKTIKSFSDTTNNPSVYQLALLPPPKTPSAQPAPAAPEGLTATLLNNGAIELAWQGSLKGGVACTVWRKLAAEADFTQIGMVTGERKFVDAQLPIGAASGVQYQVRAHRNGLSSEFSEPIAVRFGSASEGGSGEDALRIAA